MARADLQLENRSLEIPISAYPGDIVIPQKDAMLLGPSVIEQLRGVYQEFHAALYVAPDVRPDLGDVKYQRGDETVHVCQKCYLFRAEISVNTPFHALVVTSYPHSPTSTAFYENGLTWCLFFGRSRR